MTPSNEDRPLLLSVNAAAAYLGLSRTAIYDKLMRNQIVSVKSGARRFVPRKALDDYVAQLLTEQAPAEHPNQGAPGN